MPFLFKSFCFVCGLPHVFQHAEMPLEVARFASCFVSSLLPCLWFDVFVMVFLFCVVAGNLVVDKLESS